MLDIDYLRECDDALHINKEDRRPITRKQCVCCGNFLRGTDGKLEGDAYYAIEGEIICEDCIRDYLINFRWEAR